MENETIGGDWPSESDAPQLQECRVLRIEPGDFVVFETEDRLTPEEAATLKRKLDAVLADAGHAGVPTMVMSGGGHLVKTRVAA
jgi:hypothetical protein